MADRAGRPGEFELIGRYFRPLATDPGAFALADDAATIAPAPGEELVVTVDLVAEGIHFLADDPPEMVAKKALRVNLSDLAGKGAEPFAYLLALALRPDWTQSWLADFAAGLGADQAEFGVSLLGGDTSAAAGGTTIAITAFGRLPAGKMVRRSGAKPGDIVFVSGTLGDAALGLALRQDRLDRVAAAGKEAHLLERYLLPRPRVKLSPILRCYATAAMDISDGLMADLGHICEVSAVGARVEARSLPLSRAAQSALAAYPSILSMIVGGGDDYEILATVGPGNAEAFRQAAASVGIAVSAVGKILPGAGAPVLLDDNNAPIAMARLGHRHF